MPAYTFLAADTLTGTLLAELPLENVAYSIAVNDAATLTADLPLDTVGGLWGVTTPVRTSIYVDAGGELRWGGILWGRRFDSNQRKIALDCGDFLSYLDHLFITDDLTYTNADQLAIARSLVDYAMNKGGSNLHMAYDGAISSAVLRTRSYLAADRISVGQRLRELSAIDGGFDFRLRAIWSINYPRRVMTLGYPTLGRTQGFVFDATSDLSSSTFAEDGAGAANVVYATGNVAEGQPAGTAPPSYTASAATILAGGFPRIEIVQSFDDVTELTSLQGHATGKLAVTQLPIQTATLVVQGESDAPPLGSYLPGDQVTVLVSRGDVLWPNGAQITATITSINVKLDAQQSEEITIGLAVSALLVGSAA